MCNLTGHQYLTFDNILILQLMTISTIICEYVQPVRKESCCEHQLHLREELLVEAGVDDPRVEKSENNVEGICFKEDD